MVGKDTTGGSESGDIIELDTSRRRVLAAFGAAGTGLTGLKTAIENVTGQSQDGVPIVHTRDAQDNPEKVRMVSKERYRRLQVFLNVNVQSFIEKHPVVNELTLKQQSDTEDDLSIHLHLDRNTYDVRKKLPNRIDRVPITYEEKKIEKYYQDDCNCSDPNNTARTCDEFNDMKGGIQVSPDSGGWGTLCLAAYDSDDGYKKLITAHHVMDDDNFGGINQPANSCSSSRGVGSYDDYDTGHDIWAGDMDGTTVSATVGETVDALPDISGYWTYAGISDHTTTNSIYCFMAGARSWKREGYANSVSRDGYSEHEVNYGDDNGESGDSGSPYVDQDGKLVSMYNACKCALGDQWDAGTAGDYVLSTVNCSLSQ